VLPAFDVARAMQITQGRNFTERLSWTPDGKIVYASNASGSLDLYSIDARGGNPNQLTTDSGFDGMPSVSPDRRYVVFASDRAGTMQVWRMDIDGAGRWRVRV
jgi:Tol biopolymer transport system component